MTCEPEHFYKLLILRSPKSISDRLTLEYVFALFEREWYLSVSLSEKRIFERRTNDLRARTFLQVIDFTFVKIYLRQARVLSRLPTGLPTDTFALRRPATCRKTHLLVVCSCLLIVP